MDFGFRNSERISDDLVQVMRSSDDVNLVALFSSHMTKTGHLVAEASEMAYLSQVSFLVRQLLADFHYHCHNFHSGAQNCNEYASI